MNDPRPFPGEPDDGQTPLDPDEVEGLIPGWIATRGDLNAAEADNIRRSVVWANRQLAARTPVATAEFLRGLHQAMFRDVWSWAGTYRFTERNIGVAPHQIATELHNLFEDVAIWGELATYPSDEQAVRLHHRLTWIHPFPNGNGRVSRFMADCYLQQNGAAHFTWGQSLPEKRRRAVYLAAIRLADAKDYSDLMAFVAK